MLHLEKQVDGLHPTMERLGGRAPVRLLYFPTTMRDTFDKIVVSEAEAVRILT